MEFPNTGVQCSVKDCKQLDFLPFTCKYCTETFCKEHFFMKLHSCSKYVDNVANKTKKGTVFICTQDLCSNRSPIEMSCIKCKKHFCLAHRYHGCLEKSLEEKSDGLKKWEESQQKFLEVKMMVDQEVTKKLKISKNSAMANKVQLMRLKGQSTGSKDIPIADRCYFLVHPPITGPIKILEGSKGAFVSINWSIGKVIDSIADSLNIPNSNNNTSATKLRIFQYHTGNILTNEMDENLSNLLETNILIDGQDIILEYSNNDIIDCSLYK